MLPIHVLLIGIDPRIDKNYTDVTNPPEGRGKMNTSCLPAGQASLLGPIPENKAALVGAFGTVEAVRVAKGVADATPHPAVLYMYRSNYI